MSARLGPLGDELFPAERARIVRLLDEGRDASISEMAGAERIDRGYLGRILQLTLLAPDIVEMVLGGR